MAYINPSRWNNILNLLNQKRSESGFAPISYSFSGYCKQSDINILRNGTTEILASYGYTLATALHLADYPYDTWKTWDKNWIAKRSLDEIEDILNLLEIVEEPGEEPQNWCDLVEYINSKRQITYEVYTNYYQRYYIFDDFTVPNCSLTTIDDVPLYQNAVEIMLSTYGYNSLSEALHNVGYPYQNTWSSGFACKEELYAVLSSMKFQIVGTGLFSIRKRSFIGSPPVTPEKIAEACNNLSSINAETYIWQQKSWEIRSTSPSWAKRWIYVSQIIAQIDIANNWSNYGKVFLKHGASYSSTPEGMYPSNEYPLTVFTSNFFVPSPYPSSTDPYWETLWNIGREYLDMFEYPLPKTWDDPPPPPEETCRWLDITNRIINGKISFITDIPGCPPFPGFDPYALTGSVWYWEGMVAVCFHS